MYEHTFTIVFCCYTIMVLSYVWNYDYPSDINGLSDVIRLTGLNTEFVNTAFVVHSGHSEQHHIVRQVHGQLPEASIPAFLHPLTSLYLVLPCFHFSVNFSICSNYIYCKQPCLGLT